MFLSTLNVPGAVPGPALAHERQMGSLVYYVYLIDLTYPSVWTFQELSSVICSSCPTSCQQDTPVTIQALG